MLLLYIVSGVLFAASLIAAAALIAVAVRSGNALPSDLQEEPLGVDSARADLPQSAAGGLAAGDAVDV